MGVKTSVKWHQLWLTYLESVDWSGHPGIMVRLKKLNFIQCAKWLLIQILVLLNGRWQFFKSDLLRKKKQRQIWVFVFSGNILNVFLKTKKTVLYTISYNWFWMFGDISWSFNYQTYFSNVSDFAGQFCNNWWSFLIILSFFSFLFPSCL